MSQSPIQSQSTVVLIPPIMDTVIGIGMFLLCVTLYPDEYLFWEMFVSHLGAISTITGDPNTAAFIFWLGFALMSIVNIAWIILLRPIIFKILLGLATVGMILVIVPMDTDYALHTFGAGLMVLFGCLYLALAFLVTCRSPANVILATIIITVIGIHYTQLLIHPEMAQLWQKILFLTIVITVSVSWLVVEPTSSSPHPKITDRCYLRCP